MGTTPDQRVTAFLLALKTRALDAILDQFCDDNYAERYPSVGLTQHPESPNFVCIKNIRPLFEALLDSFRNFEFAELAHTPRIIAADNTITRAVIQGTLKGDHVEYWKPGGAGSDPISGIKPNPKHPRPMGDLPACAIFTLMKGADESNLIRNLAIYFDRFQLAKNLDPTSKFVHDVKMRFSITVNEDPLD